MTWSSSLRWTKNKPFPGLFLKRTCWPGTGRDAPVLIGLQWSRGKTLLRAGSAPWVVVRSEKSSSIGSGLRDDERFKQIRKARRDKGTQWYAAFGSVLPQGPFPEGAEGYRQVLLNSIRQAWKAYAGVVDEVIEELKPTAGMIPLRKEFRFNQTGLAAGNFRFAAGIGASSLATSPGRVSATAVFPCPLWVKSGHERRCCVGPLCAISGHCC